MVFVSELYLYMEYYLWSPPVPLERQVIRYHIVSSTITDTIEVSGDRLMGNFTLVPFIFGTLLFELDPSYSKL